MLKMLKKNRGNVIIIIVDKYASVHPAARLCLNIVSGNLRSSGHTVFTS